MSFWTDAIAVDNPAIWLRMSEKAGAIANDSSAAGTNAGAITGGVTLGIPGWTRDLDGSMLFNGTTGVITVPAGAFDPSANNPFTIECGVSPGVLNATTQRLLGVNPVANNGVFLFIGSDNKFRILRGDAGGGIDQPASAVVPVVGQWFHVVAVYDGAFLTISVNTVPSTPLLSSRLADTQGAPIQIGKTTGGGNAGSLGLDEAIFYNYALSPARIAAHYAAALAAPSGAGTVAPASTRYTYIAADLITNQVIAELPLYQVEFVTRLNDVGDLKAKVNLSDARANKVSNYIQNATQPGRTAIYVDRGGRLVWGGILWQANYTASSGELDLSANDFTSYMDHRYLTVTKQYGPPPLSIQDQVAILQDLVNFMQSAAGGNIGIQVPSTPASGVNRVLTYNGYEFKKIGDIFREVSSYDMGLDYAIDLAYVNGVPTKTLTLSYPRRGAVAGLTGWLFEHMAAGKAPGANPLSTGNIYDYTWSVDASVEGVTVYDIGSGSGATQLQSQASVGSLVDAGYPLLEQVFDYKDVKTQAELDAKAIADAKAYASPIALPQLSVRADQDPVLGSYAIGDDARIRILDYRFNSGVDAKNVPIGPGLDTFMRIIEIDVKAGFDQPEEVLLTMGPAQS